MPICHELPRSRFQDVRFTYPLRPDVQAGRTQKLRSAPFRAANPNLCRAVLWRLVKSEGPTERESQHKRKTQGTHAHVPFSRICVRNISVLDRFHRHLILQKPRGGTTWNANFMHRSVFEQHSGFRNVMAKRIEPKSQECNKNPRNEALKPQDSTPKP